MPSHVRSPSAACYCAPQESCVTHNMLKVAAKLLRWTGDYMYAEFTEQALLNSVRLLASAVHQASR